MKEGRRTNQTIYIWGASGYGKTSFAADFLARKKYQYFTMTKGVDIQALTEFYEDIENKEEPETPYIVVVDDLQEVREPYQREELVPLLDGMVKSKNVWLILISRAKIPMWLKVIYIQNIFVKIGEEELKFTTSMMEEYLNKWEIYPTIETRERFQKEGEGYPLYNRVVALRLKAVLGTGNKPKLAEELEILKEAERDVGDYWENRVCDGWDVQLQKFAEDISIVDSFDTELAEIVTKKNNVGWWINFAKEMGEFIIESKDKQNHVIYRLKPSFRVRLLRRLHRKATREHIDNLYKSAGLYYELRGTAEKALLMYDEAKDEESIARLLVENTRLYFGAGHYWQFRNYYLKLPEKYIKEDPELMAGMSMLQSVLLNDEESDKWYEALCDYMKKQKGARRKLARSRLLYLDIALPHTGTATMIDIMKNAAPVLIDWRCQLPEFSVTNNSPSVMDGGKDFCNWSKRDTELAKSIGWIVETILGNFGKGLVNLALAESYFAKGRDNYEVASLANHGRMQAESGGKIDIVFVAVGVLSQLSLLNNRVNEAIEMIENFRVKAWEEAPWLLSGIDALLTRIYLRNGQIVQIEEWMEQAPNEDVEFCTLERYRYMTKVRVYLCMGKKERAMGLLQRMLIFAEKRQRTYIKIEALILLAITKYRLHISDWMDTLQSAIILAEEYQFIRVLSKEGAALMPLLKATEFVWESDFKNHVMSECEKVAGFYPNYLNEKTNSERLSDIELRILQLQAEGLSATQIGRQFGMTANGIKYYTKSTYKKLGVNSKAAAMMEAKNRKWI